MYKMSKRNLILRLLATIFCILPILPVAGIQKLITKKDPIWFDKYIDYIDKKLPR